MRGQLKNPLRVRRIQRVSLNKLLEQVAQRELREAKVLLARLELLGMQELPDWKVQQVFLEQMEQQALQELRDQLEQRD
jgi:hypothetical protein